MAATSVIVAVSGGVDSAVAAMLLRDAGFSVQCLHMTNWEDDGYCDSAQEYHDARTVCDRLGLPLHRVDFSREYRDRVFARFLEEHRRGLTPNPDVLCNREIKFGVLQTYARRLGGQQLATGHYARLDKRAGSTRLLKARDSNKDQTYFLHSVHGADLSAVVFPLGDLLKEDVRRLAREARLPVADKKDSTGICFIGERPFREFLGRYLPTRPGPIRTPEGTAVGTHRGLAFYTIGQRQGLGLGGQRAFGPEPWYVAAKDSERNILIVVQGHDHPLLQTNWLLATDWHWIGRPPRSLRTGSGFRCTAKTRYRQADVDCVLRSSGDDVEIDFPQPQRAVTPGQYAVVYDGDHCLGGGIIVRAERRQALADAVQAG
jgi:tRNA-uridine 2-sulfurtransferase